MQSQKGSKIASAYNVHWFPSPASTPGCIADIQTWHWSNQANAERMKILGCQAWRKRKRNGRSLMYLEPDWMLMCNHQYFKLSSFPGVIMTFYLIEFSQPTRIACTSYPWTPYKVFEAGSMLYLEMHIVWKQIWRLLLEDQAPWVV